DVGDQGRAEAETEGQQIDDGFEGAGERGRLPEGPEVGELPAHHGQDHGRFETAHGLHSASSPVSITKTSSSEPARCTASSGIRPGAAVSAPTIAIAGPAVLTRRPSPSTRLRISARRSGGP